MLNNLYISKYEWYKRLDALCNIATLKIKFFSGGTCTFIREDRNTLKVIPHGNLRQWVKEGIITNEMFANIIKSIYTLNMQVVVITDVLGKSHRYKYYKEQLSNNPVVITKTNWMNLLDRIKSFSITLDSKESIAFNWFQGGWVDSNGYPVVLTNEMLHHIKSVFIIERNGRCHKFKY